MGSEDISVVIVAHRSRGTIARCLASVDGQTVRPREVLLLENGSAVEERIRADALPEWVTFVESDVNLGFAAGNNLLAARARGRWLAFLNPDAYPHADWIEELGRAARRYPDVTLFGSTQRLADRPDLLDGTGDVYHATGFAYRSSKRASVDHLPDEGEVFAPCAAAMMIRADVFRALAGFEEKFFCYCEDVDLGFRARLLGHRAIQLRGAVVDHVGSASSGRDSDVGYYHGVRNLVWVFLRDVPGWMMWALLPVHGATMLLRWSGAWCERRGLRFGRALRDALREWRWILASRRRIQSNRRASIGQVASAMCWSPSAPFRRSPHVRPYRPEVPRALSTAPR